jgi:hypothetical protein
MYASTGFTPLAITRTCTTSTRSANAQRPPSANGCAETRRRDAATETPPPRCKWREADMPPRCSQTLHMAAYAQACRAERLRARGSAAGRGGASMRTLRDPPGRPASAVSGHCGRCVCVWGSNRRGTDQQLMRSGPWHVNELHQQRLGRAVRTHAHRQHPCVQVSGRVMSWVTAGALL